MRKHSQAGTDDERAAVVVDRYRVVVSVRPADSHEPAPDSWRDVARQMNAHLMRVAVGITRLAAELLESSSRLVRGIGGLPSSVSKRLEQAHASAERTEADAQAHAAAAPSSLADSDVAIKEIAALLNRYRVLGNIAQINHDKDGQPMIVILRPDAHEALETAIDDAALEAGNRPTLAD